MKVRLFIFLTLTSFLYKQAVPGQDRPIHSSHHNEIVIPEQGVIGNMVSARWKSAIESRMTRQKFDSISRLVRSLSTEEKKWIDLIKSRTGVWNLYRDSLEVPFGGSPVPDTVYVLMGSFGYDDGFTYQYNTVCFDLTALYNNYGSADLAENHDRLDRLYAHEYTHLIHKTWALEHHLLLRNFRDSVLWECIYEGIGMYRSLSKRWFPQNGILPEVTANTLDKLYPVFVENITAVESSKSLTEEEKTSITANLSRGPVDKKWGAFTVAIWLILEANGKDSNLVHIVTQGLNSVIPLAEKYLTGMHKSKFQNRSNKVPDRK